MPEPEKLERLPPETVTSEATKSFADSERVKVMVEVSPTPRASSPSSSVMAMVGAVPSMVELLVAVVLLRDTASLPWLS